MGFEVFIDNILKAYLSIVGLFPESLHDLPRAFFLTVFIVLLMAFVWIFYHWIAKRDVLFLNLHRYNTTEHPVLSKIGMIFLFFVEYLVVMPFVIAAWFLALALFIMILIQDKSIADIVFLTTGLVAAVRFFAYEKPAIAKELAKLFPLISLSVFLLSTESIKFVNILTKVKEVPLLIDTIGYFFVFILIVEVGLRLYYTLKEFIVSEDERRTEWWMIPYRE